MTESYTRGYEAGQTDAAEAVRENGTVGDVRPEAGLRESALEAWQHQGPTTERDDFVRGYCAAFAKAQ
jgi:hypothetical protein